MSVRIMAEVWDTNLPPHQKLVLLAYADHANDEGTSIYPGEDLMVRKTSYSAGNIRRVTRDLIDEGILERVSKGHRGQRAVSKIETTVLRYIAAQYARQTETGENDPEPLAAQYARQTDVEKGAHTPEKGAHMDEESLSHSALKAPPGATPNHQEPSVNHQETSIAPKAQERATTNSAWDWITDPTTWNLPTQTRKQQRRVGALAREINAVLDHENIPLEERRADLDARAVAWPMHFPDATLTIDAFVKHMTALGRPPLRGDKNTVDDITTAIRDQEIIAQYDDQPQPLPKGRP